MDIAPDQAAYSPNHPHRGFGWIHVHGVHIANASIGIHVHERTHPQPVVLNLDLWVDIATPAHTCQLRDSVDYTAIVQCTRDVVLSAHFDLLETLCEHVATTLLHTFPIHLANVRIYKPEAIPGANVSISISRTRDAPESVAT